MSNKEVSQASVTRPMNYFWDYNDPAMPYVGAALGNPFLVPPPGATRTPPPTDYPKGVCPCYDMATDGWYLRADYRQIPVWNKQTGLRALCTTVDLPPELCDVGPTSEYDVWSEEEQHWVRDETKAQEGLIKERTDKKTKELADATLQVSVLTDIVELLGDAGKDYADQLLAWRLYRAKLAIFDPTNLDAPFPERPEGLDI